MVVAPPLSSLRWLTTALTGGSPAKIRGKQSRGASLKILTQVVELKRRWFGTASATAVARVSVRFLQI
jgi:hypothetical protein